MYDVALLRVFGKILLATCYNSWVKSVSQSRLRLPNVVDYGTWITLDTGLYFSNSLPNLATTLKAVGSRSQMLHPWMLLPLSRRQWWGIEGVVEDWLIDWCHCNWGGERQMWWGRIGKNWQDFESLGFSNSIIWQDTLEKVVEACCQFVSVIFPVYHLTLISIK